MSKALRKIVLTAKDFIEPGTAISLDQVPPVPDDAETRIKFGRRIFDSNNKRWEFDGHGLLVFFCQYLPKNEWKPNVSPWQKAYAP